MGIWDAFTDIVEAVTPWSVVEAEAPAEPKVRLFLTHFLSPHQLRHAPGEGAGEGAANAP
jgi:hypothetical protein